MFPYIGEINTDQVTSMDLEDNVFTFSTNLGGSAPDKVSSLNLRFPILGLGRWSKWQDIFKEDD